MQTKSILSFDVYKSISTKVNKISKSSNFKSILSGFFLVSILVSQFFNLFGFKPIKVEAASPGPFWSWNGSGTPTKITGTENLDTVAIGGFTFVPNSDYYIGLQGNQVYSWGRNDQGQLGDGTNVDVVSPTLVPSLNNISKVVTGLKTTFAITTSNTLLSWGENSGLSPSTVTGISNVVDVYPGGAGAIAVDSGGLVYDIFNNVANNVAGLSNIKKVARTYTGSYYALDNNGDVWSYGTNNFGQLGNGTTVANFTPTKIPGLSNITDISAGTEHILALDINHEVWAWGRDFEGQAGSNALNTGQTTPVKVPGLPPIKSIAGATNSSKAVDFSDKVWEWGAGKTGGQSPIPGTIPNPADPSKPMLADGGTLATNGRTTLSKRALIFEPNLKITKTASVSSIAQGGSLTFTVNYENTGNATANNVVITDTLESQFTFSSCTGGCTNSGQDVTWTIPSVLQGASGSFDVTVNVPNNAALGKTNNTATIDSDETTPVSGSTEVTITKAPTPSLFISKTASVTNAVRNDTYTYTLGYNNTTASSVNNVIITDTLDSRLSIITLDPACTNSGQVVTCNIASVPANSTGSLDITVQVSSDAAGGPLANTALITSDETASDPRSASNVININVLDAPQEPLKITKTADVATANPGDTINYTILVENNRSTSVNPQVIDVLDSRLSYNFDCNFSCNYNSNSNSGELVWNLSLSPNSSVTLTFSASVSTAAAPGDLWNTAITQYYDGTNYSSSSSTKTTINDTGQGGPTGETISLSKTSNFNQRKPGESIQYTITATYNGSGDTLYFSDDLDTRLTNISCSMACSISGQSVTWNSFFNNGNTQAFTIFADVATNAALGPLTNTVIADDQNSSQSPEPRSATNTIQIISPNNPQLSVSKTASVGVAKVGDTFNYTVNYANIGDVALTGVVVTDNLDSRLTFGSGAGCSNSGQLVTCNVGNLGVSGTGSFTFSVTVNTGAASGIAANIAVVDSNESDSTSGVTYVRIDEPLATTSLSITKSSTATNVEQDSTYSYSIDYENTSNVAVTGAKIVDTLDSRLFFNQCSNSCTFSAPTITWNLGTLQPGDTGTVTVDVTVKSNAALGLLPNTAIISSNESPQESSSYNVTVIPKATATDINITKTASQSDVPRNTNFNYTINYSNPNATGLTGVTITDTLDSRLILNSTPAGCTFASPLLTCNIGNLAASASGSITLDVNTTTNAAYGLLSNTAIISSNETSSKSSVAFISIIPTVTAGDLTLTKTASQNNLNPGDSFSYNITYTNTSGVPITGAVVTDTLDSRLNFVSCTGSCLQSGQNLTWNIGNLAVNATASFTVNVTVSNSATTGLLLNSANFSSNETGTATAIAPVAIIDPIVSPTPSLTLTKTASAQTLERGDNYTYTINYTNGPTAVTNTVITDTLDSRLNFVSCTASCLQSGQNLTWNIGNLAANATGSVTVTVTVDDYATIGALDNTAVIDSNETSSYNASVTVAIIVDPGAPRLTVIKTASDDTRAPGDTLTYTINYTNTANIPVTGSVITDTLDSRLNFVSCTASCLQSGQDLTWNIGNLAANASGSVTVTVTISNSATTGLVNNTAVFDSNETVSTSSLVAVAIIENTVVTPNIDISKIASNTSLRPGDTFTYTINYVNGPTTTTNVVITDTLNSDLAFVSCTASCLQSGQNLTWNIGTLTPSQSGSVSVTVTVNSNATLGSLDNIATIDSTETSPKSSTERVAIIVDPQTPYLKVDGNALPTKAKRGDTVVFTLNYSNPTTTPLTNTVLTVPLNSEFTYLGENAGISLSTDKITYQSCTGGCTFGSGNISWNIGNLAANASGSFTFTVSINNSAPTGLVEAGLNIDSAETSPALGKAGLAIVEDIPARIDLASSSSISTLNRGDTFTYTLTYANTGVPVTNATLSTVLDNRLDYLSCSSSCIPVGQNLTWSLGNLSANQTGSVTFNVRVKNDATPGALDNDSTIDSVETTPLVARTTVAIITNDAIASDPRLSIDVTSSDNVIQRGDKYTYTINYLNTSGQTINNSFIKNTLDSRISNLECFGCTQNGSTLNWSLGTLAAGQSGSLTYQVQLQDSASIGILSNIAIFGSDEVKPAGNSVNVLISTEVNGPLFRTGGVDSPEDTVAIKSPKQEQTLTGIILALVASIMAIAYFDLNRKTRKE